MRHPWFVGLALHEASILRILKNRRSIKRHLLRAQVRKILQKDFSESLFRAAYLSLLEVGWSIERKGPKDGVKVFPRGGKHPLKDKREQWLRKRNQMSAPYNRWGF